jgi:hypothetical protein
MLRCVQPCAQRLHCACCAEESRVEVLFESVRRLFGDRCSKARVRLEREMEHECTGPIGVPLSLLLPLYFLFRSRSCASCEASASAFGLTGILLLLTAASCLSVSQPSCLPYLSPLYEC